MAEIIYTHALTTVARIKDRVTITASSHDAELIRIINGITDFIELYCARRFKSTAYTNEVYSVRSNMLKSLRLKNSPVTALTTLEYSVGTPSNKSWTAYIADDYELHEDGKSGLVRVYGIMPQGVNTMRATYTAGYLIDWSNYGTSSHTLPADLTEVAERMVVKAFKMRENAKTTEAFDGASVTWDSYLSKDDKIILSKYKRLPEFY